MGHEWRIACLAFHPTPGPNDGLVGFARFMLGGGMLLPDIRIVVRRHGGFGCTFPRRAAIKRGGLVTHPNGDPVLVRPIEFPRDADRDAFDRAAIAAVRAAFPDALPSDRPEPATPPAPSMAPATMENVTQ